MTSVSNVCLCVCETVCERACTSVSFSALKWAGQFRFLLQEQKSNIRFSEHLCACAFVRLILRCHLSTEGGNTRRVAALGEAC